MRVFTGASRCFPVGLRILDAERRKNVSRYTESTLRTHKIPEI